MAFAAGIAGLARIAFPHLLCLNGNSSALCAADWPVCIRDLDPCCLQQRPIIRSSHTGCVKRSVLRCRDCRAAGRANFAVLCLFQVSADFARSCTLCAKSWWPW